MKVEKFALVINSPRGFIILNNIKRPFNLCFAAEHRHYDCPLCDSSVFSYCSDKLLHDACCCLKPYGKFREVHTFLSRAETQPCEKDLHML